MATTSTQFVTWEGLQYFAEQFSKTNIATMNVTTIVTNILSTHDNNTIPTTQAVYEYAAAAVDLDNDVTYTSGATGATAQDNLFNYYDKDEVNNLLNEKENHPTAGNFFPFLDLSNSANDVLCQSAFPGHNWSPNSPLALATVGSLMSSFGSQAQELIAGQKYLCFYAEGATGAGGDGSFHARVFKVLDGNTITWGDDYAVPLGSRIKTPRGTIYEIISNSFSGAKIFDCVFPHNGKFPLELSTEYPYFGVSNLKNCDILCKFGSYTNRARPSLTSLINCIITFDFTNYSYTGASDALDFEITFQGENAQVLCNPIYLGKDNARTTPVDGSFAYFSGTGWTTGSYTLSFAEYPRATYDADGNLSNIWFRFHIKNCSGWTPKEGYELIVNKMQLFINEIGTFTCKYVTQIQQVS